MSTTQHTSALDAGSPTPEVWNDSLEGNFLWTSGNLGEAVPDVMTPAAWSLIQQFIADAMVISGVKDMGPLVGNIGGRFYLNLSLTASLGVAFGISGKRFAAINEEVFGKMPEGLEIPMIPASRWHIIREILGPAISLQIRIRANLKKLPEFIATSPARCEDVRTHIGEASNAEELLTLWQNEVAPYFHEAGHMLEAAARQGGNVLMFTRTKLRRLVGLADTNALLTGLHSDQQTLESLGLLLGLTQLAQGKIDEATFARTYGHRGPHEFEISLPRPAEDPHWVEQQLASLQDAPMDVTTLLARQKDVSAQAWERFEQRYPGKVKAMRRRVARAVKAAHDREQARSEVIRSFWALRVFGLRAGELSGLGDAIFFLSIDEILAVLKGDTTAVASIPARRAAYERYKALPPYPVLISGHFDPFSWAADPQRRGDVFDAHGQTAPASTKITGFPGSKGIVEGRARIIHTPEEGDQLLPGEILVTTVTNVGWTPLFPRAGAVVTDVGAPLSHAAIVARELGIPAVVGCGNATMRLRSGDLLRVNGSEGTVEVIEAAQ